jgi:hypothetical protein
MDGEVGDITDSTVDGFGGKGGFSEGGLSPPPGSSEQLIVESFTG